MTVDLGPSGIRLLSETPSHYLFARDNCIALVERAPSGFGSIGSTGVFTGRGLAYLVWRAGRAFLAGKGFEQPLAQDFLANDLRHAFAQIRELLVDGHWGIFILATDARG